METLTIKLDEKFAKDVRKFIKNNRYSTITEFIRESMRNEMRKEEDKRKLLEGIRKTFGASKHKTTDEDLHMARERLADEYEKRLK